MESKTIDKINHSLSMIEVYSNSAFKDLNNTNLSELEKIKNVKEFVKAIDLHLLRLSKTLEFI